MVTDIVENSWAVSGDITSEAPPIIKMSAEVGRATDELRKFMFERVYHVLYDTSDARHAREILQRLYQYLKNHEEKLPAEYLSYSDETERRVVDYIAGMTDQYALNLACELGV
jgi:dGTPase